MMSFKIYNYFLVIFLCFSVNLVFSQVLTKSTEYNDKKKRRDLYYDENLNLIKEDYYTADQKIVNHIEYDTKGNVNRFISFDESGKVKLDVNFILGTYIYPKNRIELKFKGDYIFEGIQKGDKCIVNYANGKKNGVFLQTDSAVVGSKSIAVQKVDPRFLRFNILKYYVDSESESVYKLFNGVRLNFKNNVLEGGQNSYYSNGNIKFKSFYHNGIIYEHEYFDEAGNLISKILSDNGVLKKPILKNGVLKKFDNSTALINPTLHEVGDIKRNYIFKLINGTHDFITDFNSSLSDGAGNNSPLSNFLKQNAKIEIEQMAHIISEDKMQKEMWPSTFAVNRIMNSQDLKKLFDEKKYFVSDGDVLRVVFSIPIFDFKRFDFKNEEDLTPIRVSDSDNNANVNRLFEKLNSFNKFYKAEYEKISFDLNYINTKSIGAGPLKETITILDQKKYLSFFIKKLIYNISEFEINSKKYIDPFQTSLFGEEYKFKNFRVGTTKMILDYEKYFRINVIDSLKVFSDDSLSYFLITDKNKLMFSDSLQKYTFFSSEDQNGDYKIEKILLSKKGVDYVFNPEDNYGSVNDSLIVYKDVLLSENSVPARLTDTTSNWLKIVTGKDERKLSLKGFNSRDVPFGDYSVSVSFIIDRFGRGFNVQALNDPGFGTKQGAINIIYNSPPWTPAKINGKNVNSLVKMNIVFTKQE